MGVGDGGLVGGMVKGLGVDGGDLCNQKNFRVVEIIFLHGRKLYVVIAEKGGGTTLMAKVWK